MIANTSSFNAFSRNSINAHVYKHTYTPNDGRKNQLRLTLSQPYMVVNTLECLPLFVTVLQGCNRAFVTTWTFPCSWSIKQDEVKPWHILFHYNLMILQFPPIPYNSTASLTCHNGYGIPGIMFQFISCILLQTQHSSMFVNLFGPSACSLIHIHIV